MPVRRVARGKNFQYRRRRKHVGRHAAQPWPSSIVALRRPAQQRIALDRKGGAIHRNERAIGQIVDLAAMQLLGASIKAFGVQDRVYLRRTGSRGEFVRDTPKFSESLRVFAAAFEARPVPGRERSGFVEKKQLGIKTAPDVAVAAFEVDYAANPLPRRPAPRGQGLGIGVKAAAAVTEEKPARGDR